MRETDFCFLFGPGHNLVLQKKNSFWCYRDIVDVRDDDIGVHVNFFPRKTVVLSETARNCLAADFKVHWRHDFLTSSTKL